MPTRYYARNAQIQVRFYRAKRHLRTHEQLHDTFCERVWFRRSQKYGRSAQRARNHACSRKQSMRTWLISLIDFVRDAAHYSDFLSSVQVVFLVVGITRQQTATFAVSNCWHRVIAARRRIAEQVIERMSHVRSWNSRSGRCARRSL